MNRNTMPLVERVRKAAEILKSEKSVVEKALDSLGIEVGDALSENLIDADSTTKDMLRDALSCEISGQSNGERHIVPKPARVAAAVEVLKGRDPFGKDDNQNTDPACVRVDSASAASTATIVEALKEYRPISQLKDRELLERYAQERDFEMEQELHRRARGQPFIILKDGVKKDPGREAIDIDASVDLLKSARKGRVNPTIVPYGEKMANVYRITELNIDDRRVEICPVCGETLYKSYCEKCSLNWSPVGKDERAYARLVVENSGRFMKDSFADRKALHASAAAGLDDLRKTWPSMSKLFDDRKEADDLPKLVLIENRPSRIADPFHVAGNRSF